MNRYSDWAIRTGLVSLIAVPFLFAPVAVTLGILGAKAREPRGVKGLLLAIALGILGFAASIWRASQG